MSLKLTADSFLNGVRQSGLVEGPELDRLLAVFRDQSVDTRDAASLSAALVDAGAITEWQANKLLQGKHKGFTLGRYRLLSLLGRGEMSAVYLAQHVRMNRRCAIKVLPAHRVRNTSYLERFHREAQAVAALDHPNIVRAYDVDQVEEGGVEIHFLVMEYVPGRSLEAMRRERGEIGVVEAVEALRQAAAGLGHAHEAGLVHRDVKPGNLLIDNEGTVKLLDLGLARFFKEEETESLTIKHDEKVLGTADYLAPEQAVDSHDVDTRADVYSLGCTLYFVLAGRPPFVEETLVQRLLAHQTKAPTPIDQLRPDVPESLVAILDHMMAKNREDRPENATVVARELGTWLAEHGGEEWRAAHAALTIELVGAEAFRGDGGGNSAKATAAAGATDRPSLPPLPATATKTARRKPPGSSAETAILTDRPTPAPRKRRRRRPEEESRRSPQARTQPPARREAPVENPVDRSWSAWPLWQRVVFLVILSASALLGINEFVRWWNAPGTPNTTASQEEP